MSKIIIQNETTIDPISLIGREAGVCWGADITNIEKNSIYGVRMFFALQRNELKMEPSWFSNMYNLECTTQEIPEFRNIAFFHHVILKHIM